MEKEIKRGNVAKESKENKVSKVSKPSKRVPSVKVAKDVKDVKDSVSGKVEDAGVQVSVLTKENAVLREKISELKDKLSQLSAENKDLRSSNLGVRMDLSKSRETVEWQKRLLADYEADIERLRSRGFWARVFNR